MSAHELKIHDHGDLVSWRCDTCGWLGTGCPTAEFAKNEHARIVEDIRTGAIATDPHYREFTV